MKKEDLNKDFPQPVKLDSDAPKKVILTITDSETKKVLFEDIVKGKHFSTGSVGFFVGGKLTNPESGERYQVSCNIALIGSKPEKKNK